MPQLETPVVFLIFNRPDLTQRVFEEIRRAQPTTLLIVADGPRTPDEAGRCTATRAVTEQIDWPCRVLRNYSENNLGCRRRIASGISWAFEQVPEAIILEDDCLPAPTFFRFCQELLARYRDNPRVLMISGDNFQDGQLRGSASYYFSQYFHVWGWASWRRAWTHYDSEIGDWPEQKKVGLVAKHAGSTGERRFWERTFGEIYSGAFDTWDFQWTYAGWKRGGLAVMPQVNLISNLGFGPDATHTKGVNQYAALPLGEIEDLTHPGVLAPDLAADRYTAAQMFCDQEQPRLQRLCRRMRQLIVGATRRLRRCAS